MDSELDYIIASYAALKLSSSSPLKDVSINSPSKLTSSPQKQSSKILRNSPQEIFRLCWNVIELGMGKLSTVRSVDSSYLRLISSAFSQLYKLELVDKQNDIIKKHHIYIVKLIELESSLRSSYSLSLNEVRAAYLREFTKDGINPMDLLFSNATMTLKFLILQIIFKRSQLNKAFEYSDHVLRFLLNDTSYRDGLSKNQKITLVKLVLSLASSSDSIQFRFCAHLKFLQYLIQFELTFEDFIINIKRENFVEDLKTKLIGLVEYEMVPFFLFEYGMVDSSEQFMEVYQAYQKSLSGNAKYQSINWPAIVPNTLSSNRLLKLLGMPNVNNALLIDELNAVGKLNATFTQKLGDYIIQSLEKPDDHLQNVFLYYLCHVTSANKTIYEVLDKFVVSSMKFIHSPAFLEASFLRLAQFFSTHKSFKRLKNISNLFYNYSCKIRDSSYRGSFILNSLKVEIEVFKKDPHMSDLYVKLEKCIRFCVTESLDTTSVYAIVFNDDLLSNLKGENFLWRFVSFTDLFGYKIIFKDLSLIPVQSLSEENKAMTFCLAAKYSSTELGSFFTKLNISDPLLQMLCGIYYEDVPLVKAHAVKEQKSPVGQVESFIKPFYYLTQEIRSKSTVNLKRIVHLYTNGWLQKQKTHLSIVECQFLEKLVEYLKFNGYLRTLKTLLVNLGKYQSFENSHFKDWYSTEVLRNKLHMRDVAQLLPEDFDRYRLPEGNKEISTDYILKFLGYRQMKINYYLVKFDREKLVDVSAEMSYVLQRYGHLLSIDNSTSHPKTKFMKVVTSQIRLHLLSSKSASLLGKHLQSISSSRASIQLAKSFLKSNPGSFEIIKIMSSAFRGLIKTLIHLGLSKDADYYAQELSKFNASISRYKMVYSQNCYFLSYFFSISGRLDESIDWKSKADVVFHTLRLIEDGSYSENFELIFFSIISDVFIDLEKKEETKKKLSTFLSFAEKEGETNSSSWKQYFEYHFNADIAPKDTNNPFLKAMDSMITSRKLFMESQHSLKADPLFSTLEDSAMSIPSTCKEGGISESPPSSKLKSKALRNVKKSIVSLKQSRKIVINLFDDLNYLSDHHIDEMHKILSLDLLTLSSISNSYRNESVCDCYRLNDYSKNQHLLNEKKLIVSSGMPIKSLPDFDFDTTNNYTEVLGDIPTDILDRLPKDWLVVTIDICSFNGDLIISKFEYGQELPNFLRLPLSRHSSRTVDEESFSFASAISELKEIIQQSNLTTSKDRTSLIKTAEERKEWHDERRRIDENLRVLLEKIEYCWLGGFKGIFSQEKISQEQINIFKERFLVIIRQNIPSRSQKNQSSMVKIDDFIIELFLKLGDPAQLTSTELLEDLIYFVLDVLLFHGEENAYDEIDIDNIYVQVESLIKEYVTSNHSTPRNKHTVLIIGKECQSIPWESLNCLRSTSVTRMPSLTYLLTLYEHNQRLLVNKRSGGFMLNPSSDLVKTELRFKEKFEKLSSSLNWNGIVGRKPTEEEFESTLKESNVFVYIGHGGGEQFIRSTSLKRMDKIAPALLLGCSSASLRDNKLLQPSGTVYSYLIGGCPMVVGMLWDVTDKDIDKFSESMLDKWGLFNEGSAESMDICNAVRQSRDTCNLRYLNGAAPVVYGLPLSLI